MARLSSDDLWGNDTPYPGLWAGVEMREAHTSGIQPSI